VKQFHATAERTRHALGEALRPFLPEAGLVLELGSGSGQQIVHLAAVYPQLTWQPSDRDAAALASIAAWRAETGADISVREPLRLDVTDTRWPVPAADAILASYLAHLLDDAGRDALFHAAAGLLRPGARLFLFGPLAGAKPVDVASPIAALRASVWCPATQIPDRAGVAAAAAGHGLAEEAAIEVEGAVLLVLRRR
jgi:SAM-dependent methyltransferase